MSSGNIDQGFGFDLYDTHVVALGNLHSGSVLFRRAYTDFSEDLLLSLQESIQLREFFIDVKTSLLGLVSPLLTVAVAIETDLFGLFDVALDDVID